MLQAIDQASSILDSIVTSSQTVNDKMDSLEEPTSEIVEKRIEDRRKENDAVKLGVRAAQITASQIELILKDIERALSEMGHHLNSSLQTDASSSLQSTLHNDNRELLNRISQGNDRLSELTHNLPPSGHVITNIETSGIETLASGLGTNEEVLEGRKALQNALETVLGNRSSLQLIAHQLGQQLVTSEDVSQGKLGLSKFTDADLLMDTAENSPLDEELHARVLVKIEADQQNRRIGRLLNQLS